MDVGVVEKNCRPMVKHGDSVTENSVGKAGRLKAHMKLVCVCFSCKETESCYMCTVFMMQDFLT